MEKYFETFRKNTIGIDATYESPYGTQKIVYADWIASGRLYGPIEDKLMNEIGPFVANTHTETSETGTRMTHAYHKAHKLVKQHVNANENDVIITAGSGMTGVINKFQRILGLKVCGQVAHSRCIQTNDKPVVFITHMEHHSNHTSWLETIAEVVTIPPDKDLLVDPEELRKLLEKYKDRKFKLGSFSACSNVTGIFTPYHELAKVMHEYGGVCFVDFAASAPYADIDMHPEDPLEKLDAIFFSPHKFLGGPGASGVLIFDSSMYHCQVPDNPGGGTVDWTNPWGEYKFIDDIEAREDGGTPGFLQAIRAALAIELKNRMGVANIKKREDRMVEKAFEGLKKVPGLNILADNVQERLGCISFYINDVHYNLIVKLLSDRFGVQVRGGCACAGTYGHYLLHVDREHSKAITERINQGDLSEKPGWVRLSLHPIMTDAEIDYITDAIKQIAENVGTWKEDYDYNNHTNEFHHKSFPYKEKVRCALANGSVSKKERAVETFKDGYCCSQAVFSVFAEDAGLDKKTALKISDAFGGGMSTGSVCGAVTGALMVIGLNYGRTEPDDLVAKELNRDKVKAFLVAFKERRENLDCKTLLGYNISIPEEHDLAKEKGLFDNFCPKLIADAVDILDSLI